MKNDLRETAAALVAVCAAKGLTVATAESCTGGLIGAALTAVPGASEIYPGGVVSYANEVKAELLGVKESTLSRFGAVSGETALQMAEGARALLHSDLAVAVTGIAGPGGGSPGKPVGTVWVGVASPRGKRNLLLRLVGDREQVRESTVLAALTALREEAERL